MNQDIRDVVRAASACERASTTLVTVIGIAGSSYRRPGARMLIDADGRRTGSVSGGCLERGLVQRGRWLAREGPRVLRVSTAAEPDETELSYPGCGGTVELLVENIEAGASDDDPLALLRWIVEGRSAAVFATVVDGADSVPVGLRFAATGSEHRIGAGAAALWSSGHLRARQVLAERRSARHRLRVGKDEVECEVLFEFIPPARELLVCGRHHDVHAIVTMARMQGWCVTVAAGRTPAAELGNPDAILNPTPELVGAWVRDRPDAAVVLMTHSLALDRDLLGALLCEPPTAYLGLLGPYHRARDIFEELEREGVCPRSLADTRVRAPIGLDLGGDGPAAVALSIVADIQAVWSQRSARPLHQTEQRAIHSPPSEPERIPADREPVPAEPTPSRSRRVAEVAG